MTCLVCLDEVTPDPPGDEYHPACLQALFDAPRLPRVGFDRAAIPATMEQAVGKFSISGVQPKAQAQLSADGTSLEIVAQSGRYLLKPDVPAYPCLPANEHLTMALARRCGLVVPPNGLVRLTDGSLAYLVRRFDRLDDDPVRKRGQEDFCSLAGLRSGDKYRGSVEQCLKLVRRHAADPEDAARRLFLQVLFSYWVGNGDLHLKNLAMVERDDGRYTLSPAYDLVSTRLYGDLDLALPVRGKQRNVTRRNWLEVAERQAGLGRTEAQVLLDGLLVHLNEALLLVERSALADAALRQRYRDLLDERARSLGLSTGGSEEEEEEE
ncbi:MAG TPA: HipA domain-containing protein [Candidatus Nanopelagicales bacterium]|nr:HipA domain-containing protein [Candidatus Nanopelagicales bacterium]